MSRTRTRTLGLICVALALVCLGLWIPLDTDTGLIEKVRRRVQIGDALAPSVAAAFVLIGGLVLALAPGPDTDNNDPLRPLIGFGAAMAGVLIAAFVVMLYAGPLSVALANLISAEPLEYRLLRGTAPWKYIGFVLGGTGAIAGIISLAERRFSWQAVGIGAVAVLAMIALFDLPFDDLLLPPNGDV